MSFSKWKVTYSWLMPNVTRVWNKLVVILLQTRESKFFWDIFRVFILSGREEIKKVLKLNDKVHQMRKNKKASTWKHNYIPTSFLNFCVKSDMYIKRPYNNEYVIMLLAIARHSKTLTSSYTKQTNCLNQFTTILEVRGFLFAKTTQHPRSTTRFSTPIVSKLAEQSTTAKPVTNRNWNFHERLVKEHDIHKFIDATDLLVYPRVRQCR